MDLENKLLLDIEIPIANKQGVIYSHFIPSLQYLVPIKDYVRFLINFNGETTIKDIIKVRAALRRYGFNFLSTVKKYKFEKGKADNLIIRRDTHAIAENHAPFFLFIDDDVKILNSDYCKDLLGAILAMKKYPNIGTIGILNDSMKETYENMSTVFSTLPSKSMWTSGGIIFRNIENWNDIIPNELKHLYGCNIDNLLTFARYQIGLCSCKIGAPKNSQHFHDHAEQGGNIVSGVDFYNWRETIKNDNSVSKFLSQYKNGNEYGVSKFQDENFPNIINQQPIKMKYKNYTLEQLISEVIS